MPRSGAPGLFSFQRGDELSGAYGIATCFIVTVERVQHGVSVCTYIFLLYRLGTGQRVQLGQGLSPSLGRDSDGIDFYPLAQARSSRSLEGRAEGEAGPARALDASVPASHGQAARSSLSSNRLRVALDADSLRAMQSFGVCSDSTLSELGSA